MTTGTLLILAVVLSKWYFTPSKPTLHKPRVAHVKPSHEWYTCTKCSGTGCHKGEKCLPCIGGGKLCRIFK